ncbi:kinase D-interacting substrate of 220 kDa B-like [Branchiostoma floridae x Branchiostoma belcheri]
MALLNSLFEKVLKKDGTDPESASFLPSKDNSDHEQEEEVPGSCVTPAAEMERDPLGHVVSAHTIADIILDKTTEMPLTAGVFGGFGSGKSSFHAAIKKEVLKRTSVVQHYKKKIDERGVTKKGNKKEEPKNLLDRIDFYLILFCYTAMVTATIMSGLMFPLAFYYLLAGTLTAVFPIGVYYREYVGQLARLVAARLPALFARSSPMYHIIRTYLDIQVNPLDQKLLQEPPERRTDVIWVDFNAWVFSGCNVLWAGTVTRLCDEVEAHIGANNVLAVFCGLGYLVFINLNDVRSNWQAKAEASAAQPNQRILFPQWFRLLATLIVGVGLATLAAVGINLQAVAQGQFPPGVVALVPLVVGLLAKGKSAVSFGRSMVKSQSDNITSLMAQQGFAEQLGFMSEVKKEIQTVKSLLAYLERTTNIRYRIVVVVDDLSDCQEDRVVGVLQALKVLLSDEDANIISILCVNSAQVVKCVEGSLKQLEDSNTSGYKYLNEIVNFAVCLPEPGVVAMKEVLAKATPGEVGQQLPTQMAAEKAAAAPAEEAAGPDNVPAAAAPAGNHV